MNLFNYFGELQKQFKLPDNIFSSYNIINIAGKFVYIEGHQGVLTLADKKIVCKTKKGLIEIKGNDLTVKILTQTTLSIQGKIYKIEVL